MSVHYKFKAAIGYDTLPVDGINISLLELKEAIIQQKHLGKGRHFDLQITNAETNEIYTDDKILIPKNSSLIVARIPIYPSELKRMREHNRDSTALLLSNPANLMNTEDAVLAAQVSNKIKENVDLTKMSGTEEDKIHAMIAQSTIQYHPSNYVKLRKSNMTGKVPKEYKCYKCNQHGHWVQNCPLSNQVLRKTTGIPSTFLKEVKDANVAGAMITAEGKFVISHDDDGLMLIKQNEKTNIGNTSMCSSSSISKIISEGKNRETKKTQMDQATSSIVTPSGVYHKASTNYPPGTVQSISHMDQAPQKTQMDQVPSSIVPPFGAYHKASTHYSPGPAQTMSLMDQAPPGIAEFNIHVPPPGGYPMSSAHYSTGLVQSTSHIDKYMSHQPGVPLPDSSSYHQTSLYIPQNNIVEDPLSAFNALMEERDKTRESRRKIQRNRTARSNSNKIYSDYQPHNYVHSFNRYSSSRSSSSSYESYYAKVGHRHSSTSYRGVRHGLPPPSNGRHRSRSRSPLSHRRYPQNNQIYDYSRYGKIHK